MDGYRHLSFAERKDIMARWKGHEGISQIARELGRDKSTVSRVIRRNGRRGPSGRRYRASTAQGRADERRLRCRRPRLMDDPRGAPWSWGRRGTSTGPRTRYPAASRWSGRTWP